MHGSLSKEKDRCTLFNYAGVTNGLKTFGIDKIIIADNDFLFKALDCFKTILVCVDDAFTQQKYVENRELPKSTQKVLKKQRVLKIKALCLVNHSKLWLVIRL